MATLPAQVTYWRVKGAGDNAWTLDADGTFAPTAGATVEVVTVGPSPIAQIVADTIPTISGLADLSASYGASVTIAAALKASGSNLVYAMSGPAWLSINASTGQITGTAPSTDVSTTATVTVSNSAGSTTDEFAVTVNSEIVAHNFSFSGDALTVRPDYDIVNWIGYVWPVYATVDDMITPQAFPTPVAPSGSGATSSITLVDPAITGASGYIVGVTPLGGSETETDFFIGDSLKVSGLASSKSHSVRIRAYSQYPDGSINVSEWSPSTSVSTTA